MLISIIVFMTLRQIAREAGCSIMTVSRVVNKHPSVSPETAELVRSIIKKHGYTRHNRGPQPGSKLRNGTNRPSNLKTDTIAMLHSVKYPGENVLAPPFMSRLHCGLELGLKDHQMNILLSTVSSIKDIPPAISKGDVCGIVVFGEEPLNTQVRLKIREIPSVWCLTAPENEPQWCDRVGVDNDAIGRIAAEYFVAKGHRKVAFLSPLAINPSSNEIKKSYCHTAQKLGTSTSIFVEDSADYGQFDECVSKLVGRLLDSPERPTAVFVPSDMIAQLVYKSLLIRELRPGKDLEVMCSTYDTDNLVGLHPSPGALDIGVEVIALRTVEQLMYRIHHPKGESMMRLLVEPKLINGEL